MKNSNEALAILLDSKLQAAFVSPQETGDLIFDDIRLIDQGFGGFMGFHDWLRNQSFPNQIVGIRVWPHETSYLPAGVLKDRDYILFPPNEKCVQVWFGRSKNFEKQMSGDQCLGLNRILISTDKAHVALVVDLDGLSPEELMSVQSLLECTKIATWAQ